MLAVLGGAQLSAVVDIIFAGHKAGAGMGVLRVDNRGHALLLRPATAAFTDADDEEIGVGDDGAVAVDATVPFHCKASKLGGREPLGQWDGLFSVRRILRGGEGGWLEEIMYGPHEIFYDACTLMDGWLVGLDSRVQAWESVAMAGNTKREERSIFDLCKKWGNG